VTAAPPDATPDPAAAPAPVAPAPGFPRTFWTAIGAELLERTAYYGPISVLALYMKTAVVDGGLGFPPGRASLLRSLLWWLIYVLSLVSGAVADRYGFRAALCVAFAALSCGYYVAGHVSSFVGMLAAVLCISIGGSIIKPTISGTVRKTAGERQSYGFAIFYMVVNIGGLLGPVLVNPVRNHYGWRSLFWVGVIACLAALLLVATLYREPAGTRGDARPLGRVLGDTLLVVKHWKFMALIGIYALFETTWVQLFGAVELYIPTYLDPGTKTYVELITAIDAAMIVVFQLLVTKLSARLRATRAILVGFVISSLAWLINLVPPLLGLTARVSLFGQTMSVGVVFMAVSIAVFSVGEMMSGARYFEYVASMAPKDKVGLFMGYGFLSIAFGSALGDPLGTFLLWFCGERLKQPHLIFPALCLLGLLAAFLLWIYDVKVARPQAPPPSPV
jgi:proton-dependent oligopeptide transporter, POT family